MNTSVKFFHSAMQGAPVLSGSAGSLIAVLDLLVNGMGVRPVDSLSVSNGVATLTAAGSQLDAHVVLEVSGVGNQLLNGQKRVLSSSPGVVTFAAPDVPDGVAAGNITAKLAGAGWEKSFTGTNVAVYRSADIAATRMFLRVDDSGTTNARVVGYESMSDSANGSGPFPTATQVPGGGWWPKSNAAGSAARAWTLVADSKGFMLHVHAAASSGVSGSVWAFGDLDANKSGDAYGCLLQCASSDICASVMAASSSIDYASGASGVNAFVPRSFMALGSSIGCVHGVESYLPSAGAAGSISSPLVPQYPNPADNSLVLSRKIVSEPGVTMRGAVRGVCVPIQSCHSAFAWRDLIDGQGRQAGRKLMAIKCGSPAGVASQGVLFVDVTGPWGEHG